MSSKHIVRATLGLGLGLALFASAAQAQPADKRTYFTFSGPVALPGVTLPAGRYVFRIVDTTTSRKVIQVLSDDEKKPYAMANTINDTRLEPVKDATVSFYETPRGTPAAVKSWWYPGESIGYQFIYPRAQARQIAQNTGKPVLTTKSGKGDDTKSGALTRVDANGRDVDVNAPDAAGAVATAGTTNSSSTGNSNNAANTTARNSNSSSNAAGAAATSSASNSNNVSGNNNRSNASATSGFRDESANATVFNRNTPAVGSNQRTQQANAAGATSQNNGAANNAQRVARNELPKTASSLPLVGLIGMLSALAFVTLRFGTSLRF